LVDRNAVFFIADLLPLIPVYLLDMNALNGRGRNALNGDFDVSGGLGDDASQSIAEGFI